MDKNYEKEMKKFIAEEDARKKMLKNTKVLTKRQMNTDRMPWGCLIFIVPFLWCAYKLWGWILSQW